MATSLEQLADRIIETDFLIVGGGLAGCMAAIRARAKGNVDVAIMEKAAIKTSGEILGVDHHYLDHPVITGETVEEAARFLEGKRAGLGSMKLALASARDSIKPLAVMQEIGVKIVEDDGTLKVAQHQRQQGGPVFNKPVADVDGRVRVRPGDQLYYRGSDLKEKLSTAAVRSGARVYNRTMLTGLITSEGAIAGATGVNTRTGEFLVFKARAVLLSTGGVQRMYSSYSYAPFPNSLFYGTKYPGNHGGGVAAAYRAGVELTNMEFVHPYVSAAGCPGYDYVVFNMRNSRGEILEDKYPAALLHKAGGVFPLTVRGYMPSMDAPEIETDVLFCHIDNPTDEDVTCLNFMAAAERPGILKLIKGRGVDFRKAPPIELRPTGTGLAWAFSGIMPANDKGETSVNNLFTAGDVSSCAGDGCAGATTWGYRVGEHVREAISDIKPPTFGSEQIRQVEMEKKRVLAPLRLGRHGENALELEHYVRQVNKNYVHIRKVEPRLKRALELLKVVRERFLPFLGARNAHELMRVLEIQDIVELAEVHAYTSLLRTESRLGACHYRMDYPNRDDVNWTKNIVVRNVDGEMEYSLVVRD